MKAIIFDAFGTLFRVTNGGSAKKIINNITAHGNIIDEDLFLEEWKAFYKRKTIDCCEFMTERDIFTARIDMFYDRYNVERSAIEDADALLAGAYQRDAYPEVRNVLNELMKNYQIFIGSNTDNDVLESVMKRNNISVHKVYTSENLKYYKPDRKFFAMILEDAGLLAQDVLFVGDSITDDIMGPKVLGIQTAWINRNGLGGNFGQDYLISDLKDLLEIAC